MMIQLPLLWVVLCFIAGLLLGHFAPSYLYLYLSAGVLIVTTILHRCKHINLMFATVFWIILGGARMHLYTQETPKDNIHVQTVSMREHIKGRLMKAGIDNEALALSNALLTGNKDLIERGTRKAYSRAGASHLLALSGMHLGIIYGLIYMLILKWGRFSKWRWHLLPPTLLGLWGYALLAGFPFSLLRATIMLSFFTIGTLAQYRQPPLHTLSLSTLCILLISPMALFDIGFQLSFVAVFFIVTLYPSIKLFFNGKRLRWIWDILGVSFAAQLGTAPLCIYYFHILPFTGFLLSLIVVPLTMFIIYLSLITLICPWSGFGSILTLLIKIQIWAVNIWGNIPYAVIEHLHPTWWQVLTVYALLLVFCLRINSKSRQLNFHKNR